MSWELCFAGVYAGFKLEKNDLQKKYFLGIHEYIQTPHLDEIIYTHKT